MRARTLLLAGLAAACGHTASLDRTTVAGGGASDVVVSDVPVSGAETRVYLNDGDAVTGELLAVGTHAIAIHTRGEDVIIPATDIEKIRVTAYSNGALVGALATWTTIGSASTLSHGFFLIFSAPIWAITGTSTSVVAGYDPDQSAIVLGGEQAQLWQFARFPQGLPPTYPIKGNTAPAPAPAPAPTPAPAPDTSADAGSTVGDR